MRQTPMRRWIRFGICVAIPMLIGGLSGVATTSGIDTWYAYLNKPAFNPPNHLFAPVWTLLYFLMGVSLFLITNKSIIPKLVVLFGVQLLLNSAWSFIFFAFQEPGWALAEIVLLWITILLMVISYYPVNKWASILQWPYLLWVAFASVLNFYIWYLN